MIPVLGLVLSLFSMRQALVDNIQRVQTARYGLGGCRQDSDDGGSIDSGTDLCTLGCREWESCLD